MIYNLVPRILTETLEKGLARTGIGGGGGRKLMFGGCLTPVTVLKIVGTKDATLHNKCFLSS